MLLGRTTDFCIVLFFDGLVILVPVRTWRVLAVPVFRRLRLFAGHDVLELGLIDRLVLHQCIGHAIELVTMFGQNLLGKLVIRIDNLANLLIYHVRGLVRHLLVLGHRTAQEHFAFVFTVSQRAKLLGQAPLRHHVARNLSRPLNIIRSTGRHGIGAKNQFLGDAPAEQA